MNRNEDRAGAPGQEAPMVITPRMVARLIRQTLSSLRAVAKRRRHG
jgi:hypothetical protein